MSSSVKWCFLVLILSGSGSADDTTVRSFGLCTSMDSPAKCLFKGLLKNALLYAINRRTDDTVVNSIKDDTMANDKNYPVQYSKGIEEYLIDQIQNIFGHFALGFELPAGVTGPWSILKSSFFNGRGKKNKNLGPMLAAGMAVIGGTLFPLALGTLFMLAGKAIMTSLLAITISGILGLKMMFSKQESGHVKTYTAAAAPLPHYTEAQFEQELGVYRGTEGKMLTSSAANYYEEESNQHLGSYYNKGNEQQSNESNQPQFYAPIPTGASPKLGASNEHNKIVVGRKD